VAAVVAGWRPDLAFQVAFVGDPNDATSTPAWTDLTTRLRSASGLTRGRQYELDQNQAGAPTFVLDDVDEYLNPGNPQSPYAPNVVPYRQVLFQAMWPNGGTGNLLNAGMQGTVVDPSLESYTVGTTPSWVLTVGTGVSPTVSTTNPQQGTKCLTYAVTAGAGESGTGLTIPCIPGRQYTDTIYVRQTAANTTQIFIDGGAAGTSTSTINAYVRLSVTYTATQPTHKLWVASFTTGTSGTVNIDAIQHEPGGGASAFTASGPVIYGVWRGYVERWPSTWDHAGYRGRCEITCVDAFGPLNKIALWTEYRNAVLAKTPNYYWPLNEPSGSTTFAEASGNSGPSLLRYDSKYGPAATFTPGSSTAIAGDPSGVGLLINSGATTSNTPLTIVQTGLYGATPTISVGAATYPWAITWAWWIKHDTQPPSTGIPIFGKIADPGFTAAVADWEIISGSPSTLQFNLTSVTDTWGGDGKYHLYVGVRTASASGFVDTLYVDGTQVATTTTAGNFATAVNTTIEFGANINLTFNRQGLINATYAHTAVWNRALSAGEITDLWNAGKGYAGETSGARASRYLTYSWTGPTIIDTGLSVMGASNLAAGTKTLAAAQDVTTTENGNFWVDARGNTTFASRSRRYLATTSTYTFGERADLGELPYQEGVGFDFDPTLVYDRVTVANSGGITAVASSSAATKKYFPNDYSATINVQNNDEAIDHANYLLNQHGAPSQRVASITLDPAGNPNLWPVVLSLEVGTRDTVKRRATAANGGAGLTMSGDFFAEQISHDSIDMEAGTWLTTLMQSPVDLNQVGILDDTTYGRLGTAGASLHAGISATATSATVDLTGGDLFTTTGTPFRATIDSEVVTVTAVSGASSPQTFTITRPTDGSAVAHLAGAAVQAANPFVLAF
jgi:hypothetical protein